MTPDITGTAPVTTPPQGSTRRIKQVALRLPAGLAEKVEAKSRLTGLSQNQLLVQAVAVFFDEGGPATEERIEQLEADVTRAVTAFSDAAERVEDFDSRIQKLERLARQSGADL